MTNDQLCHVVQAIAISRDRQAFAELFRYLGPRLKAFGIRRGIDMAAAEELVQETMLTIWRKAETFDPSRAAVSTWVFTIVRNKRIDLLRRENYLQTEFSAALDAPTEEQPPDEILWLSEAGTVLRAIMQTLPEEQLEIVRKAFFEDRSHAEELKLPLGTVKSRIRLALAKMRVALPEQHR